LGRCAFDLNRDRLAVRTDCSSAGQLIDVGFEIFLLLPAATIEPLPEVALTIKELNADQWNAEVEALLMWSWQNTKTAGIDRRRFISARIQRRNSDRTPDVKS
jgi:hypothetical protein